MEWSWCSDLVQSESKKGAAEILRGFSSGLEVNAKALPSREWEGTSQCCQVECKAPSEASATQRDVRALSGALSKLPCGTGVLHVLVTQKAWLLALSKNFGQNGRWPTRWSWFLPLILHTHHLTLHLSAQTPRGSHVVEHQRPRRPPKSYFQGKALRNTTQQRTSYPLLSPASTPRWDPRGARLLTFGWGRGQWRNPASFCPFVCL